MKVPRAALETAVSLEALARAKSFDDIDGTIASPEPLLAVRVHTAAVVAARSSAEKGGALGEKGGASGAASEEGEGADGASREALRRIFAEIQDLARDPHPSIDVYPSENALFWRVVIEGPSGTVYGTRFG